MRPGAPSEGPDSTLADRQEPAPGADSAVSESIARTNDGAAAPAPDGRPQEQAGRPQERTVAAAQGLSARAERRRRLQGLAGLNVLGSDGKTVGRVRDIYQQDDSGELAAITVMPRQLSSRSVLIPAAAIAALPVEQPVDDTADAAAAATADDDTASDSDPATADDDTDSDTDPGADPDPTPPKPPDVVRLRIDPTTAKAGLRPPDTGHATPQMLREAAEALGLDTPSLDAASLGTGTGTGTVAAPADAAAPATGAPVPGASRAAEDA